MAAIQKLRPGWAATVPLTVCFVGLLALALADFPDQRQAVAQTKGTPVTVPVLGNASCSAVACHGSSDPLVGSPTAFCQWTFHDPHRGAYAVLKTERSRQIAERLAAGGDVIEAFEDVRCLACHVTPQLATLTSPAAKRLHADGVGCEACHGPAGKWISTHTTWANPATVHEKGQADGMRWLEDPYGRSAVCMGCHVGAPAGNGAPVRDVTHDLIAAGHPRLGFEMLTYHRGLPKHWVEANKADPNFDIQLWLAGQFESAKASIALSADRVTRKGAQWPELAEFDCFSCHHDLDPKTEFWRKQSAYWKEQPGDFTTRRPGEAFWNGWSFSYPFRSLLEPYDPGYLNEWAKLMNKPQPNKQEVQRQEREFLSWLEEWKKETLVPQKKPADWITSEIRLTKEELDRLHWTEAAQLYHALVALSLNRDGADHLPPEVAQLRRDLRFPNDPPGWYDSPKGYEPSDPRPAFLSLFADLAKNRDSGD